MSGEPLDIPVDLDLAALKRVAQYAAPFEKTFSADLVLMLICRIEANEVKVAGLRGELEEARTRIRIMSLEASNTESSAKRIIAALDGTP